MGKPTMVTLPVPLRGLNEDENPTALEDADLVEAENIWFRGNGTGTRPGLEAEGASEDYETAISGTPTIQSGHEFRATTDTVRKHVVIAGGAIMTEDAATVTKAAGVTVTSGAENVWTFAEHKDCLYAAGGAAGDTVWKWTGTGDATKVTVQSDTTNPADGVADADCDAKYIHEQFGYGFLAGFNGALPDDNPMIVRYSALNNMDSWPIENTIGGSSAVGGFDSFGDNYITGLSRFTDNRGDWVIVMTRKCLYAVVQSPDALEPFLIESTIQNGCVHQDAYVNLGTDSGDAIYMSDHGIHSVRQSQAHGAAEDSFLSWPIRKTFQQLRRSRLKYTCGTYWAEEGVVAFLVTLGHTASAHNALLCLDVHVGEPLSSKNARWTLWRIAAGIGLNRIWSARCGTAYTTAPSREFLYGGTTAGRVVRFNPLATTASDLGSPYSTKLLTKHNDFKAPGVEKGLCDAWLHLQRGAGADFMPIFKPVWDYGSRPGQQMPFNMDSVGTKLGVFVLGKDRLGSSGSVQTHHLYGVGSGRSLAWSLQTHNVNEAWYMASLSYQVRGFGEDIGGES